MSRRFAAPIALLCTLVLFLAACGDDSGDDAADDTTTSAADAEDTSTTDGDEATDDTDATDADDSDDADDADDTDDDTPANPSAEAAAILATDDFCDLWTTAEGSPTMALDDIDPEGGLESMQESMAVMRAFLTRGAELVPDEISADYLLVAGHTNELIDVLEQYEWDFLAMAAAAETDPELQAKVAAMEDPQVDASAVAVEDWVDQNC